MHCEYGCLRNSLSRNRWARSNEIQFKLALWLILTWRSHSEKFILVHELLLGDGAREGWWVTLPVFLSMSSFLQLSYRQATRQQQEPPRIPGIKSPTRYWCLTNWSCMPGDDAADICAGIVRRYTVGCFSRQVIRCATDSPEAKAWLCQNALLGWGWIKCATRITVDPQTPGCKVGQNVASTALTMQKWCSIFYSGGPWKCELANRSVPQW